MEAPATDHRRATAERNVRAILDAVEDLLGRRSQVSISAVAAQAGVSRVTVYSHFPTTEALLEAVVRRAVGRTATALEAAQPDSGPPPEALERLLAAGWRELDRNSAMAAAAATQLSPAALTRSHEAAHQRVLELVNRGRADGSFRADLPADWLVASIFALIHACADEARAGRLDADSALAVLTATIRDLITAPGSG
ncbi:MAG TPA: TetR/AcrR family transcriptional regulator [Streptosporangiaceae bacterium]|nr:TetR/AcrR family transcriptional regulator [Streptosporangiaceae bacterium]